MTLLKRTHGATHILCISTLILLSSCLDVSAFSCKQIKQFTQLYLKLHYSSKSFDDDLSKRSFNNFLKALDPAKMYFLQEDIDRFSRKYEESLDDYIQSSNCDALNEMLQAYNNRFKTRQPIINDLIDADYDFTIDEFYDISRKKRKYADSAEALNERWRKQVKLELLRLKKRFDDLDKAREKLKKRYQLSQKYLYELDPTELASIYLNAFSTALDPHSKYLSKEVLEDFHISTGLSLEGIGAVLSSEYGLTTIKSLVPGGPAQKSEALKEGDIIIAVAQGDEDPIDVVDMKLREVVKYIRGNQGTEVRLTIEREKKNKIEQHVVAVIRDKIELTDQEARGFSYEVQFEKEDEQAFGQYKVGLIQLPSFYTDFEARKTGKTDYKSSAVDVKNLIHELSQEKALDALIIDLRFNSGGSLDEAIHLAGLFIDEGPVVQVRNTNGNQQILSDQDGGKVYYDGPLVLMINRRSASSSEILAGAIRDYGRGLIVGDSHSFGKGTVQTVKEIAQGEYGAIKVTVSQFFLPGGKSTQLHGVRSDIVMPDLVDELELGEKYNDHHLPFAEIKPAAFNFQDQVTPYIDPLSQASRERIQKDSDFSKIYKDIEEYREKADTRTQISLKEGDEDTSENSKSDLNKSEEKKDKVDQSDSTKEEKTAASRPTLEEDILLRETLAITANYIQLLTHHPLTKISYPELDDLTVAEANKNATDSETFIE